MIGGSYCAIVGCKADSSKCRGLSLHSLPKKGKNDKWREALIQKINRADHLFNPDRAKICSRHFKESCFQYVRLWQRWIVGFTCVGRPYLKRRIMVDYEHFDINTYIRYAIIPSGVILGVLIALQRRKRPNDCGYYRPGLVVPMRFLDGYEERWSYALCFGAITSILINIFTLTFLNQDTDSSRYNGTSINDALFCGPSGPNSDLTTDVCRQVWVKTLLLQVQSLLASFVCAPHFACISTGYKLLGAVMGFAYSVFWLIFYIIGAVGYEKSLDRTVASLLLMRNMPIILCFIGLCIRSLWAAYKCYVAKRIWVQVVDKVVERHQVAHVISLFRKPSGESPPPERFIETIKAKLKPKMYPHFLLPTRIICIAFVQFIIIYYLGVNTTELGVECVRLLKYLPLLLPNVTGIGPLPDPIIHIFEGTYITAEVIGLMSSAIYIALFVINYRTNLISIYKGKKHLYLECPQSTSTIVAHSLRLPGYQIAYIVWGYLIIFLVILVIVGVLSVGIYFLERFHRLEATLQTLVQTLSVPLSAIGIFYLQVLLVWLFLLQPKVNEDDKERPLNINNRHVYEVVSYLLVFSNLLVGLASALFRTIKGFILGIIFLGRLDRCLLMRGFESMDPGYMAYVGTLLVDNAHNNPVMRVFCAVLLRLRCKASDKTEVGLSFLWEPPELCSNSRAARRWHLAYTLLNNPDLLPRRKLTMLLTGGIESDDQGKHLQRSLKSSSSINDINLYDHESQNDQNGDKYVLLAEEVKPAGACAEEGEGVYVGGRERQGTLREVNNPVYFETVKPTFF